MNPRRRAIIVLFPGCEILDVAGPVQALHEATVAGGVPYEILYCAATPAAITAQGLTMSALSALPAVEPTDWVFVPGYVIGSIKPPRAVVRWVRRAYEAGARICAVCSGTFLLGEAGLLDGRQCTTHWRRVDELQETFPGARVVGDRLFVEDGRIISSAGVAAGIDMTLWMLECDASPELASVVAREMVLYMRRDGTQRQDSVYLDFQRHLNPAVHQVQQFLMSHPGASDSLDELAGRFNMSRRNLSRVFKRATGISVHEYRLRLRLEHARRLLRNPRLTLDAIATTCGFANARQLRRLFVARLGQSPRKLAIDDQRLTTHD